jgi:hypothetical protein
MLMLVRLILVETNGPVDEGVDVERGVAVAVDVVDVVGGVFVGTVEWDAWVLN